MRLEGCAFLADENIHPGVVAFLRARGSDVLDVKEEGLEGSDDAKLMRLAVDQGRLILTHDSDFGALAVASGEPVIGIVYLRPGHIQPEFTIETLGVVLAQSLDVNPPFLLVAARSGLKVRVRVRELG